ncbi:hypothetical protein F441_18544 [Phytophthora nicotianae CJ01A1]|uniref:Uncharacterized protein n=5 Tax=Phytophthora nicotianae TaxID=4792 RepID=W2PKG3_PHYN3|nr:hypothetical protein PPTG_24098 [Phytophthora nicotianae INRA-310]ETI34913.1 hypothetical protein F443_18685 [Phytophthora nicotianae P1569]ETK75199.1 hypothetical protein L915_18167 [Phytophthora nicotianae]ETP04750.1 hypothetical protein F441_18544 [Phytophthora nicotianae CJ01A1]ETP32903.1 hypothetical protein F442_18488 [Phytophthora nicotianae P10297]ETL28614.1 hypothetical protein L916_18070 [Phytophthora nicotianae]
MSFVPQHELLFRPIACTRRHASCIGKAVQRALGWIAIGGQKLFSWTLPRALLASTGPVALNPSVQCSVKISTTTLVSTSCYLRLSNMMNIKGRQCSIRNRPTVRNLAHRKPLTCL